MNGVTVSSQSGRKKDSLDRYAKTSESTKGFSLSAEAEVFKQTWRQKERHHY